MPPGAPRGRSHRAAPTGSGDEHRPCEPSGGRRDRAYLGVAVQAVHVELRGPGHHEVALAVVEEVAVHGELEAGGRVRLLVHGVHGAETRLRGAARARTPRPVAHPAVGARPRGTGTAGNTVRPRPEAERKVPGACACAAPPRRSGCGADSGPRWRGLAAPPRDSACREPRSPGPCTLENETGVWGQEPCRPRVGSAWRVSLQVEASPLRQAPV